MLSPKEFEVLNYLVKGMCNRDIAEKLCVEIDTVKAHVTSIMKKFGVTNRTEAAYYAIKHKIVVL